MKSSSLTRAVLSTVLQPVFSTRPNTGRSIVCSVAPPKPKTPLYQRPPAFRATLLRAEKMACLGQKPGRLGGLRLLGLGRRPRLHPPPQGAQLAGRRRTRPALCAFVQPETEIIVDLVDDAVTGNEKLRNGIWADLGTGSGALALAVARILGVGSGRVVAADLSPVAVAVASYNVERYNLQDRIAVRLGSWFDPLEDVEGELSGLVSNPPYIPSEDIDGLQAEVSKHEPRLALDGGVNGMNDLIHLCNGAASMLKPGGFFAFETNGERQSKCLVDYMDTKMKGSFYSINITPDFAGIQRFVTGYRA
ncbi:UNVERIFIED_CONTAM: Release factor glutamine methyltransferase [Sesamum radiatum]|uniref:Release factor glutamine methyltransferase n=1 Tax=Sesamum radiatum TaxID=300843 RepID=A0AAW2KIT3_SESRA